MFQVPRSVKRRWIGVLAVLVGLLALVTTILAIHVVPAPPPTPPRTETRIELDIQGFQLDWQSQSEPASPPPQPPGLITQERAKLAGVSIGLLAIITAVVSWVRREGFWLGFLACNLAAAAIAWYVFVGVLFLLVFSGGIFAFFPADRPGH